MSTLHVHISQPSIRVSIRTGIRESGSSSVGDMLKADYDTNNNLVVDNSEELNGEPGSYYLSRANHTGTQTASTISDFSTVVATIAPPEDQSSIGTLIDDAVVASLNNTDKFAVADSGVLKSSSWSAIKTALTTVFNALYQPLNAKLTAISALVNSSGWLKNDGSGNFSYSTPTKTDVGLSNVDNLQQQPINTKLTQISGLTLTNDDIIQQKAGVLTNRTMPQLYTDLQAVSGTTIALLAGDVNNSTNVQANITGMAFSLLASSTYRIRGVIQIGCTGVGGSSLYGTFPSGASFYIHLHGRTSASNAVQYGRIDNVSAVPAGNWNIVSGGNAFGQVFYEGIVTTGITAGTLQLTFASGTNAQTSTVYQRGTVIEVTKVA